MILRDAPGEEAVPLDVLFVGGGPAGLSGAIELARLAKSHPSLSGLEIGVLEKSENLGDHCLSGAVVDPRVFHEMFPDVPASDLPFRAPVPADRVYVLSERGKLRIPTPPTMRNHGNFTASVCEIVRWLGARAEEAGVNLFTGYPADALLVDGDRVRGVRTAAFGLDRDGRPGKAYEPPTELTAKVTVLAEGTRGSLTQAYLDWSGVRSPNPQIFALGVKELWETRRPLDAVIHTLGWPLPPSAFGGSFCYPMGDGLVSLGIVVGLDYREHSLDPHEMLQRLKLHPLFRGILEGGTLAEWGAKTIPEGGYHALPERLHGPGILLAGDAAGFVNVPSLKGIHYAMHSGILAARAIVAALSAGNEGPDALASYDESVRGSFIHDDLARTRNMRLAFKKGFVSGGVRAALMTATGGRALGGFVPSETDAEAPKVTAPPVPLVPDGKLTFSKVDAVFHSGNATRDDVPSHLLVGEHVPSETAEMYRHMCPAGVYELVDGRLVVNAPNCVDCKATDVLGPRWAPRERGSGPRYKRM
jgi:electron-transferring-flavoprotein dehydrogenase